MAMPEMQKAISNLRMLLAEVKGKEAEFEVLVRQFKRQLERAPRHAIHGGNPVETTLRMMGEIQERLDEVETMQKHLSAMKRQAENELQALSITGKIEEAKRELTSIRSSHSSGEDVKQKKIDELERFIEEASARAGEAITEIFKRRNSSPNPDILYERGAPQAVGAPPLDSLESGLYAGAASAVGGVCDANKSFR